MRRIDGGEVVLHEHWGAERECGESVEQTSSHNVDVELAADQGEVLVPVDYVGSLACVLELLAVFVGIDDDVLEG